MSCPFCPCIFRDFCPFCAAGVAESVNLTVNVKLGLVFTEDRNTGNIFSSVTKCLFLKSGFIVNNAPLIDLGGKQY